MQEIGLYYHMMRKTKGAIEDVNYYCELCDIHGCHFKLYSWIDQMLNLKRWYSLSAEEILMCIEHLDNGEREELLILIKEKYNLENKLPMDAFIVGSNYDFWLCEENDI